MLTDCHGNRAGRASWQEWSLAEQRAWPPTRAGRAGARGPWGAGANPTRPHPLRGEHGDPAEGSRGRSGHLGKPTSLLLTHGGESSCWNSLRPSEAKGTPPLHPSWEGLHGCAVQEKRLHWLCSLLLQHLVGAQRNGPHVRMNKRACSQPPVAAAGGGEEAAECGGRGRDKRPAEIKLGLSDPALPCPADEGGSTHPCWAFLALTCAPGRTQTPAMRTGCQEDARSQGDPGPFPSLYPMTGELGYSGLCDGPAGKWPNSARAWVASVVQREAEGPLGPALPILLLLKVGEEAPAPARPPPGATHAPHPHRDLHLSRGYSAHSRDEEP